MKQLMKIAVFIAFISMAVFTINNNQINNYGRADIPRIFRICENLQIEV